MQKQKSKTVLKKRHFKLHQSTTDGVIRSLIHTLPLGTPQPLLLKFSMIDVRALTDFLRRRMSISNEQLCAFSESSSNVKIALNWIGVACLPCFTEVRMSKKCTAVDAKTCLSSCFLTSVKGCWYFFILMFDSGNTVLSLLFRLSHPVSMSAHLFC